jgi:hypothetical protein
LQTFLKPHHYRGTAVFVGAGLQTRAFVLSVGADFSPSSPSFAVLLAFVVAGLQTRAFVLFVGADFSPSSPSFAVLLAFVGAQHAAPSSSQFAIRPSPKPKLN